MQRQPGCWAMLGVAVNVVVVQLEGANLKDEEVKQELLVIKEVLVCA